ncbi:tyrosine kinase family catalytic domain protein [Rhizoctonia solani 123E]|uniref:Tyrosine kinase family catalytic domain protein n=1 Tax=Rhizoctonia solani 123E TaxID=1423351 RepID=A0A074RJK6_9AGAM|nr:tyrosine kinase family catalytic domain protein [Rhizoctonia solani 123E]
MASASEDKTIRLRDVNTRRRLGVLRGDHAFLSVAFSPDAKLIASGYGGFYSSSLSSFSVQVWDVQKMAAAANPFIGHDKYVNSVQFSPDGTRVVSGSSDRTILVWDVERRTTVAGPLNGHTDVVCSVAFSPDGLQIAASSVDHTVSMWDAREGRLIGNPYEGHTRCVNSVAFSPRGTYLVSGGDDKTVRIWDVRTGRQVDQPFQEHADEVCSVAFSPCGQYVASGSWDRKVIIRSIFTNSSESNHLDSYMAPKGEQSLIQSETMQIESHVSTQQMFECLVGAGCTDLSPQMDTKQETAMIMSGGGFGDIWVGHLYNRTKVAIKAWRTNTLERCHQKTMKRAARELFYWSKMRHDNIHQLLGVIVFKDQYLGMVSEWMDNGNLHEYLRKNPNADCFQLCNDVASGLDYMHRESTIHGDLKAANVLVSVNGIARISDFDFSIMSGISSLVFSESSNTRTGSIRWTAPEILCEEVTKRTTHSDVYALGMEIFTGDVPYPDCRLDFSVIMRVTQGTLPTRPIKQLKKGHQGDLMWQLLLDCWRRTPRERPSSRKVASTVCRSALYEINAVPVIKSASFNWAAAGFKAPAAPSATTWTCSTCMLSNPASATERCTVCDAKRPGASAPTSASAPAPALAAKTASATDKCTVCGSAKPGAAPATKTTSFNSGAAGIKAPSASIDSQWTCSTCSLSNLASATEMCTVCDAKKPGAVPVAKTALFDWGAAGLKALNLAAGWTCSVCGLSSPDSAAKCTVCDANR